MSVTAKPDLTGCTFRPAVEADRSAILALFNHVMAHMPRTPEEYAWQYDQGPAGPAALRLIDCGGRLVALYAGTRKRLWVHGRIVPCVMIQDVLTDPDFRGRGFLNYMAASFLSEMRADGLAGYGFPNKAAENSLPRAGWTRLMPLPTRHAKTSGGADKAAAAILEAVAQFDRETGAIWKDAGLGIGVYRDKAFLAWRYSRPGVAYHRFFIGGDRGYLVLKVFDRPDRRVVHICDLVVRKTARELLPAVLAAIHGFAAEKDASVITCWMPEAHPYASAFAGAGFASDEGEDRFVYVTGSADLWPELSEASAWHLTQADNDMY
jgi:hypothetical protein